MRGSKVRILSAAPFPSLPELPNFLRRATAAAALSPAYKTTLFVRIARLVKKYRFRKCAPEPGPSDRAVNWGAQVKKFILAMALAAAMVSSAAGQARQDFELVNKTGYEINEVYISPSKKDNWEEDILGDETLDDGESRTIRFHNSGNTCIWDLKVVYEEDDSTAVWANLDLCKVSKITIRYNRKTDTTSASFD